jgi:hypothetical protein
MLFLHRITTSRRPRPDRPLVVGPAEWIVIGPEKGPSIMVGPAPAAGLQIGPQPRGAWDDQGWKRTQQARGQIYEGYFQVVEHRTGLRHRFSGRVVATGGELLTYIADPPQEIRDHPKGPCFTADTPPWFHLHWHQPPRTVDDAILYMEKILSEALDGKLVR